MEQGFPLVDNFPVDIFKFRQQWPLGKIIVVYLGQDGKIGVATVPTADGISYIQEEIKEGIFIYFFLWGRELVEIHFISSFLCNSLSTTPVSSYKLTQTRFISLFFCYYIYYALYVSR